MWVVDGSASVTSRYFEDGKDVMAEVGIHFYKVFSCRSIHYIYVL